MELSEKFSVFSPGCIQPPALVTMYPHFPPVPMTELFVSNTNSCVTHPILSYLLKIIPRAIFFCALQIVIFPSSTSLLLSTYKQAIFLSYLKKQK